MLDNYQQISILILKYLNMYLVFIAKHAIIDKE
jgi:hypothetical protein